MPLQDFEVVGSFNHQRVTPFDPERSVNLFEYRDPLGKKPKALFSTSGLLSKIIFPETMSGASRATFVFQGVEEPEAHMYVVMGFDVYRVETTLFYTKIFSFTSSSNIGYVGVDANSHQVIFVDGQEGWIWDTLTSTATQITDPAFPVKPIDVCALDNFFVVANGDTNQFQLSMFDQGLVWGQFSTTFTGLAANDTLTVASTALWATGIPVEFSTTGTLPGGLTGGSTTYYVINNNLTIPNTIKVALSFADAIAGVAIDLTSDGTPVNTITSTGQLQLAEITSHPGNIVACRTLHRRLFLFSLNFTEVWENQGRGSNLPFRRINSLLMEFGTPAAGSIATGFGSMFFLSQDKEGLGAVVEVTGSQPIAVSNRALDWHLAQYAELNQIQDARSFLIKENGLIFYRLNFTQADHTYVYNMTLSDPTQEQGKLWHEEETLDGNRHLAQTHGFFNGKNYVGSYLTPDVYHVDSAFLTNNGQAIRRMRITRSFVPPTYQRLRCDRLQLDLLQGDINSTEVIITELELDTESSDQILTEDGDDYLIVEQGLSSQGSSVPLVYLSVSKDGGQTFGYIVTAPMGAVGYRSYRTLWRKLGVTPRGQGFVAKIEFFDAYPFAILGGSWAMDILPE